MSSARLDVGFLPIPLGSDFKGGKSQHQMVLGWGQAPGHCLLYCAVGQERYLLCQEQLDLLKPRGMNVPFSEK